jgi:hypothetical protein
MLDRDLKPGPKALLLAYYTYDNAYAHEVFHGATTKKLMTDLGISKTAFYKYRAELAEMGYITIQKNGIGLDDTIHVVDVPSKFEKTPENNPILARIYENIRQYGLFANSKTVRSLRNEGKRLFKRGEITEKELEQWTYGLGWGKMPHSAISDTRLTLISKLEYGYFAVFAGKNGVPAELAEKGLVATPKHENTLADLRIKRTCYYKHYHPLRELGYLSTYRPRDSRKHRHAYYVLNSHPDAETAQKRGELRYVGNGEIRTVQSKQTKPTVPKVCESFRRLKDEVFQTGQIPYSCKHRENAEWAVQYLTYGSLDDDKISMCFADALADVISEGIDNPKRKITYARVIDRLNSSRIKRYKSGKPYLDENLINTVIELYTENQHCIEKPRAYMRTLILDVLLNY